MKRRVAAVSLVSAAFALGAAFASGPACTSSADDGDAGEGSAFDGAYVDAPTFCDFFTEAGAPCPAASPTPCFPMCATGGCYCQATATGPRWTCTVDFSCVPDASPLDDDGPSTAEDAGNEDASDAGEAIDASVSDASDAAATLDGGVGDATIDASVTSNDAGDDSLDAADAED